MPTVQEKLEVILAVSEEDGYIDPEKVIEAGRPIDSPIHNDFTWDDAQAGHERRIDQAKRLIRLVQFTTVTETREVASVRYVADPDRPPNSKRYVDVTVAGQNLETSRRILLAELARISGAMRRAKELAIALGLEAEFEPLLRDVHRIEVRARRRTPRSVRAARSNRRGRGSRPQPDAFA